jgi:hypothetical protein
MTLCRRRCSGISIQIYSCQAAFHCSGSSENCVLHVLKITKNNFAHACTKDNQILMWDCTVAHDFPELRKAPCMGLVVHTPPDTRRTLEFAL